MKILDRNIKAVIFDMDGTLIDSTSIWTDIDKEFFAKRGINEVPDEYAKDIVHLGLQAGAKMTIERYGFYNDTVEGIIKEWTDASIDQYENKIQLKEGAIELLEYFKSKGVRIALATANDKKLYLPCLKRLRLEEYFEIIKDVNDAKEGKSSPKIFDSIIEKFNVKREETLVLEDSVMGLQTTFNAGYFSIAVYDKQSEPFDEIKRNNSYKFIYSLKELIL